MMDSNENVRYDCFRGCVISGNEETGMEEIRYRQGCCKLEVYDYLKGIGQEQLGNLFEVRFKNTRKGIMSMLPARASRPATWWSSRPRRATTWVS